MEELKKEEYEKNLTKRKEEVDGINYIRIGNKSNKIMFIALGEYDEKKQKLASAIAILCVDMGYEIVWPLKEEDSDYEEVLKKAYDKIISEECEKEYREKITSIPFKKKEIIKEEVKEKDIYLFTMGRESSHSLNILKDVKIKRAYFVNPDFSLVKYRFSLFKIDCEILCNKKDKLIKKFISKTFAHCYTDKEFENDLEGNNIVRIINWLGGKREKSYSNNRIFYFGIAGMVIGFILSSLFSGNAFIIVGCITLSILLEEFGRNYL